jgi:hypothetical protein
MRLDEILEALPDVGLSLWMLDQVGDKWHAAVYDPKSPLASRQEAEAGTPMDAMIGALKLAGVDVSDG